MTDTFAPGDRVQHTPSCSTPAIVAISGDQAWVRDENQVYGYIGDDVSAEVRDHCLLDGDCPNVCMAFLIHGVECGEGCPMWDYESEATDA
jgi:hypothetical protein